MQSPSCWKARGVLMHPNSASTEDRSKIGAYFGNTCAVSGDGQVLLVGSVYESDESRACVGSVRTFDWRRSWVPRVGYTLRGESQARLGAPLALSEDGLVAAAGSKVDGGQVQVFCQATGSWRAKGGLFSFGPGTGDSLALSARGDVLAIASPFLRKGHRVYTEGTVRVYSWQEESGEWTTRGDDLFGSATSRPGTALAMSADGDVLAISDLLHNQMQGRVRVLRWTGAAWVSQGADLEGQHPEDCFGYSLAMSGDGSVLVVGAPQDHIRCASGGTVRAFAWSVEQQRWVPRGQELLGERGAFAGRCVALCRDGQLMAYSTVSPGGSADGRGQVHVMDWDSAQARWRPRGASVAVPALGDATLCLTARKLVVASPHSAEAKDGRGTVLTFEWAASDGVPLSTSVLAPRQELGLA